MLGYIEILELKDYEFRIPSYQRGYRWTELEVRALLNDIKDFDDSDKKSWYCLQPIVVKQLKNEIDGQFELIDGQQRLTTVYIILQTMSEYMSTEMRKLEKAGYRLSYETRPGSELFLNNLKTSEERQLNPDYHFMVEAKKTVKKFLEDLDNENEDIGSIRTKLIKNTRFIWYDVTDSAEKPIEIFKKLNLGKIPLSSAELVKAILLSKKMFDRKGGEIDKQQYERSVAWDRIEYSLNEPDFWGFISNEPLNTKPCMELILNAVAINIKRTFNYEKIDERSNNFSFHVISKRISESENKVKVAKEIWEGVEKRHSRFREWFMNDELYHLIGYLIACKPLNTKWIIGSLDDNLNNGTNKKSDIRKRLIGKIKSSIGITSVDQVDQIDDLNYEVSQDKKKIANILLLFNMITIIAPLYNREQTNKFDGQLPKCDMRFPFYVYKDMKWDIEHIRAKQNDVDEGKEPENYINNLTLLDEKTNKGYGDKGFAEKREIIKSKEKQGRFIPICTQNVFNKKYTSTSQSADDFYGKWDIEVDGKDYLIEIKNTIGEFLFPEEVTAGEK